jgi:hypothetical protein
MNFSTAIASHTLLLRPRRCRRTRLNMEVLESRRLLDGSGVPAGMDLAQANWFYQNVFLPPGNVAPQWNGDVVAGDAGTLGAGYLAAIVARVNAYRWMAGLPGGVTLDPAENAEAQQDALMTAANDQLSHDPPSTWIDYTAAGADAAASSDLYLGLSGTSAIDGFMVDPGDNNTSVGHRRWILYPPTQTMGVGDIPGEADSLYVIQPQAAPVPAVTRVAWPPAGFVPAPLIPDRWSLQAPDGSDFSNATVAVTENGVAQQVEILSNSGANYGGQAIVWDMPDAPAPQPGQQVVYAVQVDNALINGQSQSFSYTTTSFDPSTTTALAPVPAAIGFLQTSAIVDPTAGSITIDVACSVSGDQPVSADYSTTDGTALAGTNYVATSGVLTFQPGQFYSQIVVPLLPGTPAQPGGTFSVNLFTPTEASVATVSACDVTINGALPVAQPDPPVLLPADSNGSPDGETTFLTSPYLIGTTEPGETVQLLDASGAVVGVTQADAAGAYEVQVPGPLSVGSYAFDVAVIDQYGDVSSPSAVQIITVVPPPAFVTMTDVEEVTNTKHQVTRLIVSFSGAVNAAEADAIKTYRLVHQGKNGSYAAKDAQVIKLKSAAYSTANDTVTLTPKVEFARRMTVRLEVDGVPPSGLQDTDGRYIDGDQNGTAGGNAIAILSKNGATIGAVKLACTVWQPTAARAVVGALPQREELADLKHARRAQRAEHHPRS